MSAPARAATLSDPYPLYAELVARAPLAPDDSGTWVAAGADAVRAVLHHPGAAVRPADAPVPAGIVGTPAGAIFGRLARMTDGAEHERARSLVDRGIGAVDPADDEHPARHAAALVRGRLAGPRTGLLTDLMWEVPVRAVAATLGVPGDAVPGAVADFVRTVPATAGPDDHRAADDAARVLGPLAEQALDRPATALARAVAEATPSAAGCPRANVVGLVTQTYEATAGLIGNGLLALRREGLEVLDHGADAVVAEVARHDAPIQSTRRFLRAALRVDAPAGAVVVPTGAAVLVLLAAANRDPAANSDPDRFRPDRPSPEVFTFGAGPHRCPGRAWAEGIAAAVLTTLRDDLARAGHDVADLDLPADPAYVPSPNARIPRL